MDILSGMETLFRRIVIIGLITTKEISQINWHANTQTPSYVITVICVAFKHNSIPVEAVALCTTVPASAFKIN